MDIVRSTQGFNPYSPSCFLLLLFNPSLKEISPNVLTSLTKVGF